MKAAFYTRQGSATEVLSVGEQTDVTAGPNEICVRVRASGVNPSDVKMRQGHMGPMAYPLIIPHNDGAGDVVRVGASISPALIGQRVWLWNGQWQRAYGTACEYIALPANQAVELPESVSYEAGACLGIPAMTAFNAVGLIDAQPGQTVLISGGAGAVSHYAIQIAKAQGLRVLATVSGEAKARHANDAGANAVINYKEEDVGVSVLAANGGKPVDALIELDIAANAKFIPQILKAHGQVVVYGYSAATAPLPLQWLMRSSVRIQFMLVYDLTREQRTAAVSGITRLLQANALKHAIGARFTLDQIVQAQQAVESGSVIGNVVVNPA